MGEYDAATEREALEALEDALDQPSDKREEYVRSHTALSEAARRRAIELLQTDFGGLCTGSATLLDEEGESDPEQIGIYRILRLIGRGGMGNVYLAERAADDFDHVVAIKIIKSRLITPEIAERFRRERQILADLNHPNIARLFDGGETEDGAPYIVMEYVKGQPLHRWLAQSDRSLDVKLSIFRQICAAVQAAHQRLVIHRDLTPPNVLVTAENEVKLIDFGIARPDSEEADTEAQEAGYTPGFAPPEQRSGASASTLTDIYALGKLLALLLEDTDGRELSAIASKAASDKPEHRYPTVRGLSRDIERYLDRYPVEAREGGRIYVLSKFFARNRLFVLSGLATLALLLSALTMTIYAYAQAENERERAQQRFAETRAIARTMMFDVYDEVSRVPGSVSARLLLADTAQRYLESLAADDSADADVRFDAAQGYFRLAEVTGARTGGGTVGQTSRAKRFYRRSRDLLESLHAQYPERPDIQAALGGVIAVMADSALFSDGNFETAEANARTARRLLGGLPELDAINAGALGMTYLHEGNAVAWRGEPESAGEVYRAGLRTIAGLRSEFRAAPSVMRAQAELLRMMGAYHTYFERPAEASEVLERSLAIHRSIARRTDYAPRDIYGLVTALQAVAQLSFAGGDIERADRLATEAVARARQGMAASPNDVGLKELFTGVAILKGHILASRGRNREAVALADEAIRIKRSLVRLSGDVVSGRMTLAVRLQEASEVYLLSGRGELACPVMREAAGIMHDYEETAELPIANRTNNLEPMLEALRAC